MPRKISYAIGYHSFKLTMNCIILNYNISIGDHNICMRKNLFALEAS